MRTTTTIRTSITAIAIVCYSCFGMVLVADDEAQSRHESVAQDTLYKTVIKPLLQAKCFGCHGEVTRKAGLNLETAAGIAKGGESGAVVKPLEPDKSLLYEKIHSGEMPPDEKEHLSDAELELIERWIRNGAKLDHGEGETPDSPARLNQHDVIPIMLRRCAACHGRHQQLAQLDLRSKTAMLKGGKSGPAIIPGKPDESLLLQKIHAGEMPPLERLVEVSVKPIEPAEVETLAKWIAAGAPEVTVAPDIATTIGDPLVSDDDRNFWAFRSPQMVDIPSVRNPDRVRNEIDAFILQKLETAGLSLNVEADRLVLIRRATIDLTGLPPEPAAVETFIEDTNPEAYESLIDRLLDSPRYGERWGRYWLDAAGYADSEGKREQDLPRPYAWRYRDYVIRSFNADKPFDRFLKEQIAGDELADYENAPEITPEIYDNLVATAFLRMTPDATWANITGYVPDRIDVVADEIDVLGSAVMGLTLKCARCHTHKFDPIPHRDYYRLVDIFKGAYDEYAWLKPEIRPGIGPVSQDVIGGRSLPFVTTAERKAWELHEARITEDIAAAKVNSEPEDRIKAIEAQRHSEPRIQALWDRGEPSPTYIYRRGDWLSPSDLVGAGVPSVLTDGKTPFEVTPPWPGAKQTGRRLAFALWLIQPDHPLTARVQVNQIWMHHFGSGIVKTPGNFGLAGMLPTHPELLDWLAREFVQRGWSLKEMHRLMMTSAAYRQSSTLSTLIENVDPQNALYSRMPLTRLDAEALYDSLLLVAGRLDETRFGPGDPVQARADGLVTPSRTERGWRRSIYVQQLRKQLATHLESFDFPQMNPNCIERRNSMVAPQALHLMNNGMVLELAEHFAERVIRQVNSDATQQIGYAHLIALGRPPTDEELQIGLESLHQLQADWTKQLSLDGRLDHAIVQSKALTAYCHAIMNSASFLFVD
ncbi:MAG: PSD1 and planctomycete cytochrome C domain-containing protein [Aureliella sp.]